MTDYTPRILQDPTTGDVLHADDRHRREIAEAWTNASNQERRADLASAALDLAEAQIARVLGLHVPSPQDGIFCAECSTGYPCRTVRIFRGEENGT